MLNKSLSKPEKWTQRTKVSAEVVVQGIYARKSICISGQNVHSYVPLTDTVSDVHEKDLSKKPVESFGEVTPVLISLVFNFFTWHENGKEHVSINY